MKGTAKQQKIEKKTHDLPALEETELLRPEERHGAGEEEAPGDVWGKCGSAGKALAPLERRIRHGRQICSYRSQTYGRDAGNANQ